MRGNKYLIPLIILIVLIAIIIIGNQLSNKAPKESEIKFFPGLEEKMIGAINIKEGSTQIRLRKKGEIWVIADLSSQKKESKTDSTQKATFGDSTSSTSSLDSIKEYPVDSSSIATAIEKLINLKKGAIVSENPSKQSVFEVDSSKGLFVEVVDKNGKSIGTVIIGKSGPDYNSNYIRLKGSNSVYMSEGSIRYSFFTDVKRWRDKNILKFDKNTVAGLTLVRKDTTTKTGTSTTTITIARSDTGNPWKIIEPTPNPAKTEEVENILDKLSSLYALDFQDEPLADSAMGFDKPELGITVSFKNGSSRNVIFGKKNSEGRYWLKTDAKEQIYLVSEYIFNQVNKKYDDLKGEPLVKPIDKKEEIKDTTKTEKSDKSKKSKEKTEKSKTSEGKDTTKIEKK